MQNGSENRIELQIWKGVAVHKEIPQYVSSKAIENTRSRNLFYHGFKMEPIITFKLIDYQL